MIKAFMTIIFGTLVLCACSQKTASHSLDDMDCPSSPNCVSSLATESKRQIDPFHLKKDYADNWEKMKTELSNMPRTQIIKSSEKIIHAECKSRIFRFTDDLVLILAPLTGRVDIRSASRVGYSDLGVNHKRIKNLRTHLKKKNIID